MTSMDALTTPGPYDGYLSLRASGEWEVSVAGVLITVLPAREEETARAVLAEHAGGRPAWKVTPELGAARLS